MVKIKLGDLCVPSAGQIKEDAEELIDYFDISSVDNETKKVTGFQTMSFGESPSRARKAVKKGSILVSTVRPNLNAVALLEEDTPNISVASTGFCILNCKENVDNRFVFSFCKSKPFIDAMVSQATGASYPAVSDKIVRAALVPKYTYEEQCNISETLDKVSNVIDSRKAELSALDDLIKARFIELFGDPATPGEKFKTSKLGEVADVKSSHRVFTTEFVDEGVPFYRGTEIGALASGQQPEDSYRISMEHYLKIASDDSKPMRGDLLLPSICNKGQVWMVDTDEPFYYKDGRVLCISPDRSVFDSRYLQFYMKIRTEAEYPKLGSGSTFAEFKIFQLKELGVDIPPINAQKAFNLFADQVDKSKFSVFNTINILFNI